VASVPALVLAAFGMTHPHFLTAQTAAHWQHLHVLLLPVFPLLALGFIVPLWRRPTPDLTGYVTVIAWIGAFVYATFYTGLDLVAGFSAGTVARNTAQPADLGAAVQPLFETGDRFGQVGVGGFLVAAVALSVVLYRRQGPVALLVAVILLGAGYSFLDSHIFWPRGVFTMLAIAVGFGVAAWISGRPDKLPRGPAV
jgi:hypothetical protein